MSLLVYETAQVLALVSNASELEAVLSAAVEQVRVAADGNTKQGILITALAPGSFLVNLSDEVPYGTTQERYAY